MQAWELRKANPTVRKIQAVFTRVQRHHVHCSRQAHAVRKRLRLRRLWSVQPWRAAKLYISWQCIHRRDDEDCAAMLATISRYIQATGLRNHAKREEILSKTQGKTRRCPETLALLHIRFSFSYRLTERLSVWSIRHDFQEALRDFFSFFVASTILKFLHQ